MSSRGQAPPVALSQALLSGLAPDGGLWCPERLDPIDPGFIDRLTGTPADVIARTVAVHLLGDAIPPADVEAIVASSLDFPIPLRHVGSNVWALELFHGPTLAFKDVGARFMARLMAYALRGADAETRGEAATGIAPGAVRQAAVERKAASARTAGRELRPAVAIGFTANGSAEPQREDGVAGGDTVVLVATSGDTGSAVARAFLGVPGFRVVVLFPEDRISEPQRKLFTTLGGNVRSLAVAGSFDDCQRLVKEAFRDAALRARVRLASANSINVGRLLPQVLYYFLGVSQLPAGSPPAVIATPSGNFGNLTAGLYAKRLGLPVRRFVAATNVNDVIPEYLETGVFRPRPSRATLSNAMDVGDPSNFERIRHLYASDLEALRRDLAGSRHTDDEVQAAIRRVHEEHGYVLDPHTAVGWLAIEALRGEHPESPGIVLATAHPAKFPAAVETALGHSIPLPPALAEPLGRDEAVERIAPSYDAFHRLLLRS